MTEARLLVFRAEQPAEPIHEERWPERDDPVSVAHRVGTERRWGSGVFIIALFEGPEPRAWRRIALALPPPAPDPFRPIEVLADLARLSRGAR